MMEDMERSVLYLDSPRCGEPYKWSIEEMFEFPVVLTKNVGLAAILIEKDKCGLIIAEPMVFGNPHGKSLLIPIFGRGREKGVKIMVRSTVPEDVILRVCGIRRTMYDIFLSKVKEKPSDFYHNIEINFGKIGVNIPTP